MSANIYRTTIGVMNILSPRQAC